LEWQWCALKAHSRAIEHGKKSFLVHPKLFFSLGVGLNSNDLGDEWSILSMIITPCAFCGRKFPLVWDYQLASCMHMYHFLRPTTHLFFYFHQMFGEGLQYSGDASRLGNDLIM
jgi:hypothetical protein